MKSVLRDTTQKTCSYKAKTQLTYKLIVQSIHSVKKYNMTGIKTYQKYQWSIKAEHLKEK